MFIQEKEYISDWKCDIEEIINKAFDKSSKISKNIPSKRDLDFLPFGNNNYTDNKFYKELSNKIEKKSFEMDVQHKEELINSIFDLAEQNNNEAEIKLRDYQHSMLFTDIVELNFMQRFFNLKNCGISFFESFLYFDILKISNAGEYGYSQKTSIDQIAKFITNNIDIQNIHGMRRKRLFEFVDLLKKASAHLEETKKI